MTRNTTPGYPFPYPGVAPSVGDMSDEHSSHATYDELSSTEEMHADCEAMRTNMPVLRLLGAVQVPAQRTAAQASAMGEAARRVAAKQLFVVTDTAAKFAARVNPFD